MSHTQPVEAIKYGGCDVMIFSFAGYKVHYITFFGYIFEG